MAAIKLLCLLKPVLEFDGINSANRAYEALVAAPVLDRTYTTPKRVIKLYQDVEIIKTVYKYK